MQTIFNSLFFIWFFSLAVAVIRFFIPGHDASLPGTYEAFAHIWVGFLIGLAIFRSDRRNLAIWLLISITALEGYMFLHRGGH